MTDADEWAERALNLAAEARALQRAGGDRAAGAPFSLAFLTDARRGPDPFAVAQALPAGAALIVRHYDEPAREALARALLALCRPRGVLVLIGADIALAERIGADGAHLRAGQLAAPPPRAPGLIVTAACHDEAELARARAAGAAAAFLSPVFPTRSHPGSRGLGAGAFRAMARAARLPVLALGGVQATNAGALAGENVAGFGAVGAFGRR